jgi:hypothetical protein
MRALGKKQRELFKYVYDLDGVLTGYYADRLSYRPGWGRSSVGDTARTLMDRGLLAKKAPAEQPMYPLKLTRTGRREARALFEKPKAGRR